MPDPATPEPPSPDPVPPEVAALAPLESVGWSDRVAALFASSPSMSADTGALPARVVRVDRDRCTVVLTDGDVDRRRYPLPAVGDWVVRHRSRRRRTRPTWSRRCCRGGRR